MITNDSKETIRSYLADYLAQRGLPTSKNFPCLSGSHQDKHPSMGFDRANNRVRCFSCGTKYDIFDLIGMDYGLTDFNDQYKKACDMYGITQDKQPEPAKPAEPKKPAADYTDFFLQANADLDKTNYYRGISFETLNKYKVGYVAEWRMPLDVYLAKDPNRTEAGWNMIPKTPRLIIPTSKNGYLARDTRPDLTAEQKEYCKQKIGQVSVFNYKAMATAAKPIIIVEGEIDALSIIDLGYDAVALGSTSYIDIFIDSVKEQKPKQPFIIALDNDERGQAAVKDLQEKLEKIGHKSTLANICGSCKDANEALLHDRSELQRTIAAAVTAADPEEAKKRKELERLRAESANNSYTNFADHISNRRTQPKISTGFASLDAIIGGSMYPGLYTIGAISSLGKTTFVLQIADGIAATGKDVLLFSLEMDKYELMAKSLSRKTFLDDYRTAKTTRDILTGSCNSPEEQIAINDAMEWYFNGSVGRHIYIQEGVGNIGVDQIKERVQRHYSLTGSAPVVIIDYLQILAPADVRSSDKQNTDVAVLELKRMSRDYNTPVVAISSLNRANYTEPINLAAFKESGAIEYSSDVLMGLQYDNMDYVEGESEKARETRVRSLIKKAIADGANGQRQQVQVKVLKNRNGKRGDTVLGFYPMFNCFIDGGNLG